MSAQSQPTQREHIFISYRRDDARGASGRIYDWLRIDFGRERVFRDVHSIGVGKWRDKIDAALARKRGLRGGDRPALGRRHNLPRLHDAGDMVRHELVTALASDAITLVPTLVEGAELPKTAALPAELRPLFEVWNARRVTEDGWEGDIRRLIAEIAQAACLVVGPDLDTLLSDAAATLQRVAELEQTNRLQASQIEALRRTLDELTGKLAEASAAERSGLAAAFAALAQGDTLAAENAFEHEYGAQSRAADEARRTMAEAARNVANLALLHDVRKAADFYRKAIAAEPERADTSRLLGYALIALGELNQAQEMFNCSLWTAQVAGDLRGEMAARIGQGDVSMRVDNLSDARRAYAAVLRLGRRLRTIDRGRVLLAVRARARLRQIRRCTARSGSWIDGVSRIPQGAYQP